jgi:predicted nucleic acid binding AN1-type Zn finger protein
VYLPFHCDYCDQYFCGKHRLPFEHNCKNISEWKKTSGSGGTTVESKAGNLFVRK